MSKKTRLNAVTFEEKEEEKAPLTTETNFETDKPK